MPPLRGAAAGAAATKELGSLKASERKRAIAECQKHLNEPRNRSAMTAARWVRVVMGAARCASLEVEAGIRDAKKWSQAEVALEFLERAVRLADAGGVRRLVRCARNLATGAAEVLSRHAGMRRDSFPSAYARIIGIIASSKAYVASFEAWHRGAVIEGLGAVVRAKKGPVVAAAAAALARLGESLVGSGKAVDARAVEVCCACCAGHAPNTEAVLEAVGLLSLAFRNFPATTALAADPEAIAKTVRGVQASTPRRLRAALLELLVAGGVSTTSGAAARLREMALPEFELDVAAALATTPYAPEPVAIDVDVIARPGLLSKILGRLATLVEDPLGPPLWRARAAEIAASADVTLEDVSTARRRWCFRLAAWAPEAEIADLPALAAAQREALELVADGVVDVSEAWDRVVSACRRQLEKEDSSSSSSSRSAIRAVEAALGLATTAAFRPLLPLLAPPALFRVLSRLGDDAPRSYAPLAARAALSSDDPADVDAAARALVATLVGDATIRDLFVEEDDPWTDRVNLVVPVPRGGEPRVDDAALDDALPAAADGDDNPLLAAFRAAAVATALAPIISRQKVRALAAPVRTHLEEAATTDINALSRAARVGCLAVALATTLYDDDAGIVRACGDLGRAALRAAPLSPTDNSEEEGDSASDDEDDDDDEEGSWSEMSAAAEQEEDAWSDEDSEPATKRPKVRAAALTKEERATRLWLARLAIAAGLGVAALFKARSDRGDAAVAARCLRANPDLALAVLEAPVRPSPRLDDDETRRSGVAAEIATTSWSRSAPLLGEDVEALAAACCVPGCPPGIRRRAIQVARKGLAERDVASARAVATLPELKDEALELEAGPMRLVALGGLAVDDATALVGLVEALSDSPGGLAGACVARAAVRAGFSCARALLDARVARLLCAWRRPFAAFPRRLFDATRLAAAAAPLSLFGRIPESSFFSSKNDAEDAAAAFAVASIVRELRPDAAGAAIPTKKKKKNSPRVVLGILEATDDVLDALVGASWCPRAARRAIDRETLARFATPVLLRLGRALRRAERPLLPRAFAAFDLALDLLDYDHPGAACAAVASLAAASELDDRRSFALESIDKLVARSQTLAPGLRATLLAVNPGLDLAPAPLALLSRRRRRLVLTDAGITPAVPDLEPGDGPLERPRRLKALAEKDFLKGAISRRRALTSLLAETTHPAERALLKDCLADSNDDDDDDDSDVAELEEGLEPDSVESRKRVLSRELARSLVSPSDAIAAAAVRSAARVNYDDDNNNNSDDPHLAMLAGLATAAAEGWQEEEPCSMQTEEESSPWEQQFAWSLAKHGEDAFFRACADLCAASGPFARLALPALVYETKGALAESLEQVKKDPRTAAAIVVEVANFARAQNRNTSISFFVEDSSTLAAAANAVGLPAAAAFYAGGSRGPLLEAYSKLGDADVLRVLSSDHSTPERVALYRAEKAWTSLLGLADATSEPPAVALALRELGLSHVVDFYAKGADLGEARDEAAWRAGRWDDDDDKIDSRVSKTFHGAFREALSRLARRDCVGADKYLAIARDRSEDLSRLAALADAREGVDAVRAKLDVDGDGDALFRWLEKVDDFGTTDFSAAAREAWLRAARRAAAGDARASRAATEAIRRTLLVAAENATAKGRVDAAVAAVARLEKEVTTTTTTTSNRWQESVDLAAAKILWARGRASDATRRVRRVATFEGLRLAGSWCVEARSLPPSQILETYLRPAARCRDEPRVDEARFALGEYVARLHDDATRRLESPEWRQGERVARDRRNELEAIRRDSRRKELAHRERVLERECRADDQARNAARDNRRAYLVEAVDALALVVANAGTFSLAARAATRLLALWFNNAPVPEVAATLGRARAAPFAPLLYQVTSRLGSLPSKEDAKALERLVLGLCEAVPDHAILQLVALANGDNVAGDKDATEFLRNRDAFSRARVSSAARLLDGLPNRRGLPTLADAYVDLAMFDVSGLDATIPLASLKRAGDFFRRQSRGDDDAAVVVVTSLPTARDAAASSNHDSTPRVCGYEDPIRTTASGIHAPKILRCVGSDGRKYRQLVKGCDDVRQDAVMEQVFDALNDIVVAHFSKRRLVRTYNVVPLSPRAGVVEWVEFTKSFSDVLVGDRRRKTNQGVHGRYRRDDIHDSDCRRRMLDAQEKVKKKKQRSSTAVLREAFDFICEEFQPAFRYFFLERFGDDPDTWLKQIRRYSTSVATASMVGYVLGIGDRHCQNILVCERAAEVVHIDFGIAFEQGKALSKPETVPFRLTRDVVDGMGVAKTDGLFLSCSVRVMAALRDHATTVITILEVLLHDPLYNWMLSPKNARARQQTDDDHHHLAPPFDPDTSSSHNQTPAAAERVLLRVKHKLLGYADDAAGQLLSVEGQVNHLITMASDPDNLCHLFHGWAPWL
ncbi:hypothetical protein CTAYLR_000935 [Chrysophaeum taylorii]|uniref:non-specific serine/threonine protein kinase n=1 Tax=Chrysophaeum taylorii TaxID=2483200 RepID=A0AAD7UHN0_9STRA|nr:hypothetical protein CTAYLR_000935 [Chrysophaeum taylorii]